MGEPGSEEPSVSMPPMLINVKESMPSQPDKTPKLDIVYPMDDAVIIEGNPVTLKVKIVGPPGPTHKWLKDGVPVEFGERISFVAEENIFELSIKDVIMADQGLYRFIVQNITTYRSCKAKLFVGIKDMSPNPVKRYMGPTTRYLLDLKHHLDSTTVQVGNKILLYAKFRSSATHPFRWFKNNHPIVCNERLELLSTDSTSTLIIKKSRETDSGIYILVSKCDVGVSSTWTDVQVIEHSLQSFCEYTPFLEQCPRDVEVNLCGELRLTAKVWKTSSSTIKWFKGGKPIKHSRKGEYQDFGNNYYGFRIKKPSAKDLVDYSLALKDHLKVSNVSVSSTVRARRGRAPSSHRRTALVKPLQSAIAVAGSAIHLSYTFEKDNRRRTVETVKWYIGHYAVTQSDSRFKVFSKDSMHFIEISKFEHGMTGEVLCELSSAKLRQGNCVTGRATCTLSLVPPSVIMEESELALRASLPSEIMYVRYSKWTDGGLLSTSAREVDMFRAQQEPTLPPVNTILLEVEYSKLDTDRFYFLRVVKKVEDERIVITEVYEVLPTANDHQSYYFSWHYPMELTDTGESPFWYRIELILNNGYKVTEAITKDSLVHFDRPIIGKPIKFNVWTVAPEIISGNGLTSIGPKTGDVDKDDDAPVFSSRRRGDRDRYLEPQPPGRRGFHSEAKRKRTSTKEAGHSKGSSKGHSKGLSKCKDKAVESQLQGLRHLMFTRIMCIFEKFTSPVLVLVVIEYPWGKEVFNLMEDKDVIPYVRQICPMEFIRDHASRCPPSLCALAPAPGASNALMADLNKSPESPPEWIDWPPPEDSNAPMDEFHAYLLRTVNCMTYPRDTRTDGLGKAPLEASEDKYVILNRHPRNTIIRCASTRSDQA